MNRLKNAGRRRLNTSLLAGAASAAVACLCGRAHAQGHGPSPQVAGERPSHRSQLLSEGAAVLQTKAPLNAMNLYLNGFHFYADDMGRPVEAYHFCTHLTEDMHQCTIFDSNEPDARLIGVEYIISERLFNGLPEDEKKLWHSHHYETTSGLLVMPGIPDKIETTAMQMLATTYGKTWHMWQVDRGDTLPLGIPQLMMGFTRDGQLDPNAIAARDKKLGVSMQEKRQARAEIPVPQPAAGANTWESGQTPQMTLHTVPVKNRT